MNSNAETVKGSRGWFPFAHPTLPPCLLKGRYGEGIRAATAYLRTNEIDRSSSFEESWETHLPALRLVLFGSFWSFHDSKADHLVTVDRVIVVAAFTVIGVPLEGAVFFRPVDEGREMQPLLVPAAGLA